ncbi:MAG: amidase [Solirubrobacterales bacterium]
MNEQELAFAGAARQAELVRSKQVSPSELVDLYLERIDRIDPQLNAFRVVMAEKARAEAKRAEERLSAGEQGPLLGVPIAIKDDRSEHVEGESTTHGTATWDQPERSDSELVARVRRAGAIIIGKTLLPELAIHGYTESQTFGITRNPWNPERTTGGSSGGSAAAVTAGMVPIAHASDGAGSIRYPAAHCGLFGLKPQRDRVPINPPGHWLGLSVNGCVSRTVADTALFLDAVTAAGSWSRSAPPPPERPFAESASTAPGKLRIAVTVKPPRAAAPPLLGEESRRVVEETAELLRSLGHEVEWRDPEWGGVGNQIPARYLGGIAEDVDETPDPSRLEPLTRGYGRLARVIAPGWARRRAVRLEGADRERIGRIFDDHDVLLTPMTAGPPFEHGRFSKRGALRCLLGESRFYPYAVAFNHTGQPAAAVPAGRSSEDLPLAVQIVGRPNDESTLLSLAAQLEAERPWADRRPAFV